MVIKLKKIIFSLTVIFALAISRIFYLSVLKNNYYKELLDIKTNIKVEGLDAPRGRILDVNGNILVDNKQIKVIIANTYGLIEQEIIESVKELAKIISIDGNVSEYNLKYYYYINNKKEVDDLISDDVKTKYKERKISSKELLFIKLKTTIIDIKLIKIYKYIILFFIILLWIKT